MKSPPSTVTKALKELKSSRCPEDIFGDIPGEVTDSYRSWVKIVHPDKVSNSLVEKAKEAFILLSKIYSEAEKKIENGSYGDKKPSVIGVLHTKTADYRLTDLNEIKSNSSDVSDFYNASTDSGAPCEVKLCRSPADNDLLKIEADILAKLPIELSKPEHSAYFPNLLDSFEIQQGKVKVRANVFTPTSDMVSLVQVKETYPDGLDPKDAAWMWNRMLESLHLLHCQDYIHGNVTPDKFFIQPDSHVGMLTDFSYAVKVGSPARAISSNWNNFYPEDLLAKKTLNTGVDLYMAACCMNFLLGANNSEITTIPDGTPVAIAGLLRSCWLGKAYRTKSAEDLYADFKEVRHGLGWPKGFRPFNLTPKTLSSV